MSHFLEIKALKDQQLRQLAQRALEFKHQGIWPQFPKEHVANLFYENSTRTRVSFELAARNLGMNVINLDLNKSSEAKGEAIGDTLLTLNAMGINNFVVRHGHDGLPQELAEVLDTKARVINAGDGKNSHPSQALLDLVTIMEHKPDLAALKVVVLGNIRHSRVANSFQWVAKKMGIGKLVMVAPKLWQPEAICYGQLTDNLAEALIDADVIMCLRIQKERLDEHENLDLKTYRENYSLSEAKLKLAKPKALVMHPGPINRGIEIDSEVADGQQSVILQQVQNGVFARMAILESVLTQ